MNQINGLLAWLNANPAVRNALVLLLTAAAGAVAADLGLDLGAGAAGADAVEKVTP